eukprot:31307-Pelagococcus_subviridis.AAC.3
MSFVMTPPSVSRPSDSGVTSRRTMSLTSPPRTPACTAAPSATTSSGLTDMFGSFPVSFFTSARTAGMRVEPPTRITSSISSSDSFASRSAFSTGTLQRVMRSSQSSSNLARVRLVSMCFGPSAVAVMNGREMDAEGVDDSSIFAFSAASVDPFCGLEVLREPLHDPLVEVVAAEVRVARRGEHLEDAVANLQDGHVKGAAAEVEDQDRLVRLLLEAVREARRGRLVDDAQNFDAGDGARVLRRLTLRVVEVGGDGDHSLGHRVAKVGRGVVAQLAEHLRGDLLRGEVLARGGALELDVAVLALLGRVRDLLRLLADFVPPAADEALDGEEESSSGGAGEIAGGAGGGGEGRQRGGKEGGSDAERSEGEDGWFQASKKEGAFGDGTEKQRRGGVIARGGETRLSDEPVAVLRVRDDGRRRAAALCVRDDRRGATFHGGDLGGEGGRAADEGSGGVN